MSYVNRCYLLVEALNIDSAVLDTNKLSVIRGGSYLLAKAVDSVARGFRADLRPLSTGASSGLFAIHSARAGGVVAADIARWLGHQPPYRGLTFAVETCVADDLSQAREQLAAKARFRQLRQVSLVPDKGRKAADRPCAWHGRRRADAAGAGPGEDQRLSDSVARRYRIGRALRTGIYRDILQRVLEEQSDQPEGLDDDQRERLEALAGRLPDLGFTGDLETLGRCEAFRALNNKLAVIYLDGNRFGDIQRRHAADDDAQSRFDRQLRRDRALLLAALLGALLPNDAGEALLPQTCVPADPEGGHPRRRLRFETLLWGGDEMTLVVPAWLGFEVMQRVFAQTSRWSFADQPLTHAGGLVFCHTGTPIARARDLARQLADDIKDGRKQTPERAPEDRFDYLVLESVDYPVEPTLEAFRAGRYGAAANGWRRPLAPSGDWSTMRKACRGLLTGNGLARGQVFALARRIRSEAPGLLFGDTPGVLGPPWQSPTAQVADATPFEAAERHIVELAEEHRPGLHRDLEQVAQLLGCDRFDQRERAWLWLHLTELWDYLVPERDCGAPAAAPEARA